MLGVPNRVSAAGPGLGFRRIALVRARVGPRATRFEVEGIAHRRPVVRTVSARLASQLVASGVRLVVHRERPVDGMPAC